MQAFGAFAPGAFVVGSGMALIMIMVDGVGLAPASAANPVANGLPAITALLDAPLTNALNIRAEAVTAHAIDATLGVPGLPQSGSGHTAIYGGYNAAAANGRHQPSHPTIAMREQLARHNLLLAARNLGRRVAWANAYLPGYADAVHRRKLRHTAGTWAALHAGLELRGVAALRGETAVSWDITQALARTRPGCTDLPEIRAEAAGARLAMLAKTHDLVAFETYLPDLAGHARIPMSVPEALVAVDGLIAGVVAARRAADSVIVTSDHGNSEDATTRIHTRNPVPLLVIGPAAPNFVQMSAIDQLAPALLAFLEAPDAA